MTQFVEPNMKSDLVAPRVIDWLQSLRAGIVNGFTVTKSSPLNDFDIDIASGTLVTNGTTLRDDLTRIGSTILSTALTAPLGADTHAMVYASYTYQDTFPPAAMSFEVAISTGSPPSPPSLPADSIKLADIFIPAGSTDLTNADIVNAPAIPDRGNADGDVLLERVVSSNANVVVTGGGAFQLSGGYLTWEDPLVLYATTVTHKEQYKSAPIAKTTIAANPSPSTTVPMGNNAIAFVIFDRSDTTPKTPSLQILDLDNPTSAAMNAFYDAATRERVVFVAMSQGGTLIRRAGFGNLFADEVVYDPTASGLVATDVQEAIDELVTTIGGLAAADISFDPSGVSWLSSTDVQAVIEEVANDLGATGAGTSGASLVGYDGIAAAGSIPALPASALDAAVDALHAALAGHADGDSAGSHANFPLLDGTRAQTRVLINGTADQISFDPIIPDRECLSVEAVDLLGASTATGAANSSPLDLAPAYIEDSGASYTVNEFAGAYVAITGGGNPGTGQRRRVLSNTATRIYVTGDWSTVPTGFEFRVYDWRLRTKAHNSTLLLTPDEYSRQELANVMTGSLFLSSHRNSNSGIETARYTTGAISFGNEPDTNTYRPRVVEFAESSGGIIYKSKKTVIDNDLTFEIEKKVSDKTGRLLLSDGTNMRRVDGQAFGDLAAFEEALKIESTSRRSRVMTGCELVPVHAIGGTSQGAAYQVKPGVVIFPNGLVGIWNTLGYGLGYWDHDLDAAHESIAGTTGWTPADGSAPNIQFFYHFMRMKDGDALPAVFFDLNPPDAYGRPQSVGGSHATAGYTVNDYAFIGTMCLNDMKASTLEAVWKGGAVVEDLGGGLRRVGIANLHELKANSDFLNSQTILSITSGGVGHTVIYDDSVHTNLVHAKEAQITLNGTVTENGVGGGDEVMIRCPGMAMFYEGFSGAATREWNAVVNVPLQDSDDISLSLQVNGGTGQYSLAAKIGIASFVENVNNLYRRGPALGTY